MTEDAAAFSNGGSSIYSDDGIDDIAKHPISCLWKAWKGSNKKERKSFDFQLFQKKLSNLPSRSEG
jgi:hypothetical protein